MVCTSLISFKRKKWTLTPADDAATEALAQQLRCPRLIARLLVSRGIATAEEAVAFLNPAFKNLHSPWLLPNMEAAATRIAAAVAAGEKIVLFGDYDVDGITGTTMLWHLLKAAKANVDFYIPHRVSEGYGLSTAAIEQIIDGGAQLVVTIDCGISALEPITAAKARGVDVVVSDHHEIPAELPPAFAIVHPRLPGSAYPNPDLCGAGVAFKLAWATAQKICNAEKVTPRFRELLLEFSGLAALGTVADVVPLVGENRILVKFGLAQVPRTANPGLQALIDAAGYGDGKKMDTVAVGFSLAPRLNAAGRMGHAREAVELLTTAEGARCAEIATWLEQQNRQRQSTERKILEVARAQIAAMLAEQEQLPQVIVVHHETFHAGVVGIVASRIVDQFHRPAFVLAGAADEAHGSARSIPGFELHHAIDHCRALLISGGGHAMAGGVKLHARDLAAFTQRLNDYAAGVLTPELLTPALPVDAELSLEECDVSTLAWIEKLEPFGRGNARPRFALRNVRISAPPRRVGATGNHLQLQIGKGSRAARCIAFGMGDIEPQLRVGTDIHLVVEAKIDHYMDMARVDLQVIDVARCDDEPLAAPIAAPAKEPASV